MWDFVDRRYLSLFMKITQKALSEVYFSDVHRLYQSKLDLEYMQENARWLPWLTVMNKEKKRIMRRLIYLVMIIYCQNWLVK
ncbi:hypothetical protein AFI02nite_42420 [Aliivibrio fischeri]|uniref:Uncharacterized protein n=1 Tax=Aliivibrio fischeri TaxID=668 RepID=A0A510UP13_ALIFS|nr:hypothetical protein AFI02nite_42420 [Aliivibrio fischeri]